MQFGSNFGQNYATLHLMIHSLRIFFKFCTIIKHNSRPFQECHGIDIWLFSCYYYTDNCHWFLNQSYVNKYFDSDSYDICCTLYLKNHTPYDIYLW